MDVIGDQNTGETCHYPFSHDSINYTACAYDEPTTGDISTKLNL